MTDMYKGCNMIMLVVGKSQIVTMYILNFGFPKKATSENYLAIPRGLYKEERLLPANKAEQLLVKLSPNTAAERTLTDTINIGSSRSLTVTQKPPALHAHMHAYN